VVDLKKSNPRQWDEEKIRQHFNRESTKSILNIHFSKESNFSEEEKNTFTVKFAYKLD
jgi:hypothetical protein